MQKYLDILKNSALFSGIDTKDLINMFKCLLMNIKTYEKNSYILKASEPLVEVGIILKGRVNIIKEDYWGNRTILTTLSTGDLFGESFVFTNINNNCFSIVTAEKAEIMFLNYQPPRLGGTFLLFCWTGTSTDCPGAWRAPASIAPRHPAEWTPLGWNSRFWVGSE